MNRWNSLTQELVDSESVNSFKSGLEKLRKRKMGFFMDWHLTSPKAARRLWLYETLLNTEDEQSYAAA